MRFYSAGGLGDALIVAAKILQTNNINLQSSSWSHFEKRTTFFPQCLDIMRLIVGNVTCEQSNDPDVQARIFARSNGQYYNTKITEMKYPYINEKIGHDFGIPDKPHICIQTVAGRLNDTTRREIGIDVIEQMATFYPNKLIVLVGPERLDIVNTNVVNMTGMTQNILDVFHYINGCSLFIGQDGICAYYSAFIGKPTIINYHLPNLIHHYFNDNWDNVAPLIGINYVKNIPESGECLRIMKLGRNAV